MGTIIRIALRFLRKIAGRGGRTRPPPPPRRPPVQPRLRQQYTSEVNALATRAQQMRASGASSETIARTVHAERRALGVKYKDLTPEDLRQQIYQRNMEKYGDPLGPSIDWLRARGRSWEDIIESASRPGGRDLGF